MLTKALALRGSHRRPLPTSRAAEAASRMTWPTTKQALRSRIASYRRILRQEFVAHGGFGDGYGKRFWLFTLYFLLRDDDEVRAYIDWYRSMFPDDHGEISQLLCWALMLHRFGREDEALLSIQTREGKCLAFRALPRNPKDD